MSSSKTAMVLAAGLGTRLKAYTQFRPKALMNYQNTPLLEIVIRNLMNAGFNRIIINIHHFGDQIIAFLKENSNFGAEMIISDEREELLDTGGGIKKASLYFKDQPVLIHNVDIITSLNLEALYDFHMKQSVVATLAVKERDTSRSLLTDEKHLLCGWRNNQTGEEIITRKRDHFERVAFSGIYVMDPEFPELMEGEGAFSVMPEILRISEKRDILLYPHHQDLWKDMGKPEAY